MLTVLKTHLPSDTPIVGCVAPLQPRCPREMPSTSKPCMVTRLPRVERAATQRMHGRGWIDSSHRNETCRSALLDPLDIIPAPDVPLCRLSLTPAGSTHEPSVAIAREARLLVHKRAKPTPGTRCGARNAGRSGERRVSCQSLAGRWNGGCAFAAIAAVACPRSLARRLGLSALGDRTVEGRPTTAYRQDGTSTCRPHAHAPADVTVRCHMHPPHVANVVVDAGDGGGWVRLTWVGL